MAFELLTETPALLRERHYVHFSDAWPAATNKANKWFQVERALQIKYDVSRIIAAGDTQDLNLDETTGGVGNTNLALIPTNPSSLYEILVGIKAHNILFYPYYANSYYLFLESSGLLPSVADNNLRYLGFYEAKDSPFESPHLREHVIKDQEDPILRVYNDSGLAERIVFRFIVNRCRLVPVQAPIDPVILDRARRIRYFNETRW